MRIFYFVLALLIFTGCGEAGQKQEPDTTETKDHAVHEKETVNLEQGAKWKIDAATKTNFESIKALLSVEKPANNEGYQQLSSNLKTQTDKMIKECRMEGPDHDALHVWLTDFFTDMKGLTAPGSDQEKAFNALKEDVGEFEGMFEM